MEVRTLLGQVNNKYDGVSTDRGQEGPFIQSAFVLRVCSRRRTEYMNHTFLVYKPLMPTPHTADSENALAFSRFFFHPRVLRAVSACDPSTTILGFKSTIPVFACGAALAKLGHPLGSCLPSYMTDDERD